ncbi:MAG: DUF58 domain-containing protein [Verrucomicrobiota bacterium]
MLPSIDSQLCDLDTRCRYAVEHFLAGEYRSVFKGRGIEFEDVREYIPGDDVRSIDWKVTARTGVPHIKRYIEEREQIFYLLVDASSSMKCGYRPGEISRWWTLVELSFLLAMAAVKNNDRIGLILFSNEVKRIIPPSKGRQHVMSLMDVLIKEGEAQEGGEQTNFNAALRSFAHLANKRSLAVVLSDFFVMNYEEELKALAYRHDVIAGCISRPNEVTSSTSGLVRMIDSESRKMRVVDFGATDQSGVQELAKRRLSDLRDLMLECRADFFECLAGADCVSVLSDFFKSRLRRLADETGG